MNKEMLEKVLNANKNLIIEGDIVSGKTTNIIFPIVENIISKRENLFIIDAKEEYINNYFNELKENGYNTIIINLRDLNKSEGWNTLEYPYNLYKNGNTDKALEYLTRMGKTMFYESKDSIDSFWINSAADFFTGVTLALFEDGKENEINFNSINHMFSEIDQKFGTSDYLTTYYESKNKDDMSYIYASPTILSPKETRGGILATARQKLKLFASSELLSQFMSKTTFNFSDFTSNPTAIIFIARDENPYLNTLLAMFIEQLYGRLLDTRCPFNFILDNFDIIEKQNELVDMLGSCLARNIKMFIGTRSLEELINKYGNYIQKLCDFIKIQNDKLVLNINNITEEYPKNFKNVIIEDANIEYPKLNNTNIELFDLRKKAIEVKKSQFTSMDFSTPNFDQTPFNADELIKDIDNKLAQLEMEEKNKNNKEKENIKSELSQFKIDN